MPGHCNFNNAWLVDKNYERWVQKDQKDRCKAKCRLCDKGIDIIITLRIMINLIRLIF